MRVLVLGGGGREHALCWRLAQSGHTVFCSPGNAGTAEDYPALGIADDPVAAAIAARIDLVVVGPEKPLVDGVADLFRAAGIDVFGPGAAGARLEASKVYCKTFCEQHGIPTGAGWACSTVQEAVAAIERCGSVSVIKADGLAAGKGVAVCDTREEAVAAAREMLEGEKFGEASKRILVEERLEGRELSVLAIVDGHQYRVLAPAEDHKAVFDGDRGPNTGGMGAVCPASWASPALLQEVRASIFDPTMRGLLQDGIDFRGVLYAGLMIDDSGPRLLEYNVRFGDPETQVLLPRLQGDLGEILQSAARGDLGSTELSFSDEVAVGVVLASRGYPESPDTGKEVSVGAIDDVLVFHAGTRRNGTKLITSGGRVLTVVATAADLNSARARAYTVARAVQFDGVHYRRDIGARVR